jgi:restriction system protein
MSSPLTTPLSDVLSITISRLPGWLGVGGPRDEGQKAISGMMRADFDACVTEAFQRAGYKVQVLDPDAGAGAELQLTNKAGRRFLVLLREWRAGSVGMKTLEAFHNAIAAQHAAGGFLLSAGRFEDDVRETAPRVQVLLVNGDKLAKFLARP